MPESSRRAKEVDAWSKAHENTKKDVVMRVREGSGNTSRVMKIATVAEANKARPEIERIVGAWRDWRDEPQTKRAPAR